MTKQKKTNLYKVTLRCKHSDWNENISVYENLLPTLRNSDKAEETCNTAPKLHIKLQTQLQILKQALGNMKRQLKIKSRKDQTVRNRELNDFRKEREEKDRQK